MSQRTYLSLGMFGVFAALSGVLLAPSATTAVSAPMEQPEQSAPTPRFQWMGVASCSAMACHGEIGPRGSPRCEYTTWIQQDKHARAYQVLLNDRSRQIARNLGLKEAHREGVCLNCHVHPGWDDAQRHEYFAIADGVGCESCHGPAEKWLNRHYLDDWATLPASEKERLGWHDTKDLLSRARQCATCHVGAASGEVNHDLIAAGHPPLRFEFSAYHATLPRHWSERKDRERYPDLAMRAWSVGQVVSASAALELLEHRAASARAPWPELAEYDCFACHHDLTAKNWRQERGEAGGRLGALPYNDWYTALLPHALNADLTEEMKAVRQTMEIPLPNREEVRQRAKAALEGLNVWQEKLARRPADGSAALLERFTLLTRADERRALKSWDEATQVYLALAAHYHALRDEKAAIPANVRPALDNLAAQLRFPDGWESPRSFTPAAIRDLLKQFQSPGSK